MVAGQRETISRLERLNIQTKDHVGQRIWIHAASLGEFEQGRPLIEKIRENYPQSKIVLSFFSPSGMEVRKDYDKVDMTVYLPFDTKWNVNQFLDTLNPTIAIFIKYEFWGNYLTELHRRQIPTYLISGIFRPSQHFFKWWGGQFRQMLRCFTHLYLQNENSRELLAGIGISNVTVTGDTRLDRVYQIMQAAKGDDIIKKIIDSGTRRTLIAGSTWPADENLLFDWLKRHSEYRSIIAPHEVDDNRLKSIQVALGEGTWFLSELHKFWSRHKDIPEDVQHIIVDCYGLLAAIYRYGTVAYVGGGFGAGIHNINEAAVYGIPVIFGPNYHKFQEAKDLINLGGGFSISSQEEFNNTLNRLILDDDARNNAGHIAKNYILASRGATDRIFNDLF